MAAIGRAKQDYIMQVESSGDVEEISEPHERSTANFTWDSTWNSTINNWSCVHCCASEHDKTRILFKPQFDTGLDSIEDAGYAAFNKERKTAFTKCGAITSQRALFTNHLELFLAWGAVSARLAAFTFCHKACAPPQKIHPARAIFQTFIAESAAEMKKADKHVVDYSDMLTKSMSPAAKKNMLKFYSDMGTCRTGCFSGKIGVGAASGSGTFCADTTSSSLSVCKTMWFANGLEGTCKGMKVTPAKGEFAPAAFASLVDGSGSCSAKKKINKIVCEPGNKWRAYLKGRMTVEVKISSECLLEEFAQNWELTIDEVLDHSEHGPHAEDLLVDCYRHSQNEGISLVERSRRDASHLNHQLEDRHMERAISLFEKLSEENKKHQSIPAGFAIDFKE